MMSEITGKTGVEFAGKVLAMLDDSPCYVGRYSLLCWTIVLAMLDDSPVLAILDDSPVLAMLDDSPCYVGRRSLLCWTIILAMLDELQMPRSGVPMLRYNFFDVQAV